MNLEIAITDITPVNKREKLIKLSHVLSEQMGLDAKIYPPSMAKAWNEGLHPRDGAGQFALAPDAGGGGGAPVSNNQRRIDAANRAQLITGVEQANANSANYKLVARRELQKITDRIKSEKGVYCEALGNRKLAGILKNHLTYKGGNPRQIMDVIKRTRLLPFVVPIIEKYGLYSGEKRENKHGGYDYELVGKAEIEGEKQAITVIVSEMRTNKDNLIYISVFGVQDNMIKSFGGADGSNCAGGNSQSPFLPLFSKGLSPSNHDLIIPQITAMSIAKLPNIELFIKNVTDENRKAKFAKAIRTVGRILKVPVSVEKKREGEPYLYPVQQELADQWIRYYRGILKTVYETVIVALDLPRVEVETMRKAIDDSGMLRYRGKVIYSPETGKPLKNRDFDALIEAIQNFLNRNTKDISKRIVLDSVAIGKLLWRMAKYQSSSDMTRLKLGGLKYRGKTFDWIRDDIKNIKNVLGENITGPEMARYQVAQDYVANLVTKVNQGVKDEIKDTVLSGILNKRSKGQVSQDLFNRLGGLNRDWKRIADTEIVNTSNLAGIMEEVHNTPQGEKVYFKRYELAGCCDKCAKVNGKVVLWSETPLNNDDKINDEHTDTAIWEGKEPKKGKTTLVTGTLHPHCRGGWVRWSGEKTDAMSAQILGKVDAWDAAVKQAREEYRSQGTENPNDQTKGYVDRINEVYRENLGEK
jgi:hypothetical protein